MLAIAYNEDHPNKPLHFDSASYSDEDEALQAKDHFDLPDFQFQENPPRLDEEDIGGDEEAEIQIDAADEEDKDDEDDGGFGSDDGADKEEGDDKEDGDENENDDDPEYQG